MEKTDKLHVLAALKQEIFRLQGFKPGSPAKNIFALSLWNECFPEKTFPTAATHEFFPYSGSSVAATVGFLSGLLSSLLGNKGVAIWIGKSINTFPPALNAFGLSPEQIIFIKTDNEKHLLWTTEEALKCTAVSVVVGELNDLSFLASRRLQLAVEKSQVTGLILRKKVGKLNTTASVSRWRITSLPSESEENLPGIGYPTWKVELLKIRNGKPGQWDVQWKDAHFMPVEREMVNDAVQAKRNVG